MTLLPPRSRSWLALSALALLLAPWALGAGRERAVRVRLDAGSAVVLTAEHRIFLEAAPLRGEGLLAFARRLTGSDQAASLIAEENRGTKALLSGNKYRVPYGVLSPALQLSAMRALFGDDVAQVSGWLHHVHKLGSLPLPTMVQLAEWFTGKPEYVFALLERNGLEATQLRAGDRIEIPADLLLPAFRDALPASPVETVAVASPLAPAPAAPPGVPAVAPPTILPAASLPAVLAAGDFKLEYGRDAEGPYAIYRLRPGEALYSSVVVRFTGRVLAVDVNELAEEIAKRSRIADVTDIPIGYRVKIPFDVLLPEFLPVGDPLRRQWEEAREAAARFGNQVQALGLDGVTVILDAGHGGRDIGASFSGVWESLYVYDIMLRVRTLLERHTSARVISTVADGNRTLPEERDVLPYSRGHRVLTDPPYAIEEATIGTNLRWYLANSIFRRERARKVEAEKVVFLSIHADSLHPSLTGAMVYVPDAQLRAGTFAKQGAVYEARNEVREQQQVSFSWESRVKSEGLSRDLAEHVIAGFRRNHLAVHPEKPIREKIIRRRSEYVPAVLRYNAIPAKVLLEVCNLANEEDRRLLQTAAHRQRMAKAVVEGLLAYYGYQDRELDARIAAAGGGR